MHDKAGDPPWFIKHYIYSGLFSELPAESNPFRVAVYHSAPFGFQKIGGSFGGMMVELWSKIAEDLDIEFSYFFIDMQELIAGLEPGTYNVGVGAITITP